MLFFGIIIAFQNTGKIYAFQAYNKITEEYQC